MVEIDTRVMFIAKVRCKHPKSSKPDYKWCYVTIPMDVRNLLEGKWVRVYIEPIEEKKLVEGGEDDENLF